jgi:hypothetical protein
MNRFTKDDFGKHPYRRSIGKRRPCYRKEALTLISLTTVGTDKSSARIVLGYMARIEKRSRIVSTTLLFLQFVDIVTKCIIIFMTLIVLLNSLVDSFSANGYAS